MPSTTCSEGLRDTRERCSRRGQGATLFDEIVDIIREHGPGGRESEDSIVLELV
jgi:hypothetical protein